MKKVNNNIRQALNSQGKKQSFLVKNTGLSKQYISNIVCNKDNPTLHDAIVIADLLDTKVDDLFYL